MGTKLRDMLRVSVAMALGVATAVLIGISGNEWHFAPVVGWIVAATIYLASTWLLVLPMDAEKTADHVRRRYEDGTPRLSHLIVLLSSVASLAGVGHLLAAGHHGRPVADALVGVLSVVASWCAVHTTFMLRYALLYFHGERGDPDPEPEPIDYNGGPGYRPCYLDFAYLAFTVGMTYQVADTNLTTRRMRRAVLGHALVSFMLGAVVLASTVNLVLALAA